MEENQERIEELQAQIAEHRQELEKMRYGYSDELRESMQAERMNLLRLINDKQQEIDKLMGKATIENVKEVGETIKEINELKGKVAEETKNITRELHILRNQIDKLEEERKVADEERKENGLPKNIELDEFYNDKIKQIKRQIEEKEKALEEYNKKIEMYYKENMDKLLRSLTKGRIDTEKEIKDIEEQIKNKNEELTKIQYGTEEVFEEIELEDGTKEKVGKVFILYDEIEKLKKQLEEKNKFKEDIENLIKEVKGEKEISLTPILIPELQDNGDKGDRSGKGDGSDKGDGSGKGGPEGPEGPGGNRGQPGGPEGPEGPGGNGGQQEGPEGPGGNGRQPEGPEGPGGNGGQPGGPERPGGNGGQPGGPERPGPSNLPVRSGLQVYRDLLNEVGYIKGSKVIAFHDAVNKANFFLINKAIAWGIRKITGRKEEVARIEGILDKIERENPADFELLINEFLLKDNDTLNITKYKVNEILLEAVQRKCDRMFSEREPELRTAENELRKQYEQVEEQLRNHPEKATELNQQLVTLGVHIQQVQDTRETLERRGRTIQRGKEEKSYDRKDNIKGGIFANRNPDNRNEINKLADIELAGLKAAKRGDYVRAAQTLHQMDQYADSKTVYKRDRKGRVKVSKGAFQAKEGDINIITNRRNMTPELIGSVGMILTSAGLGYLTALKQQQAMQAQVDKAIKDAETNVNNQINTINANRAKAFSGTNIVQSGKDSIKADAIQHNAVGERVADLKGGYNTASAAYRAADQAGVTRAGNMAKQATDFNPAGYSPSEQAIKILGQKAEIARAGSTGMKDLGKSAADYYAAVGTTVSHGGVDHAIIAGLEQQSATFADSHAEFYTGLANVIGNLTSTKLQEISITSPQLGMALQPLVGTPTQVLTALGRNVTEIGKHGAPALVGLAPAVTLTAKQQIEGNKKREIDDIQK